MIMIEKREITNYWRLVEHIACLCSALLLLVGCSGTQSSPDAESSSETRVLFIGNSYTFFNDLPDMFVELAQAGGREVDVAMSAKGGWTLAKHADSEATMEMIEQQEWDYVVLQEQSVIPSQPKERKQDMYPAIRILDSRIKESGADTVLYMTWGRRDGLPSAGYQDFDAMQTQLASGYMSIADELNTMVAPVGIAWQNALAIDPTMDLWQGDGSHPNKKGSYLAACVLYAAIFQESPEGLAYTARLSEGLGQFFQSIAADTVLEERERWHIH